MEDDDYVIECKASPLKMDQVETTFERYEAMRGGCRFQSIDGTTALVIFGHPSTGK
jgi:GR25 family glycosyltransferase involved in LPS biosynthesis